jgi:hypothetical protein
VEHIYFGKKSAVLQKSTLNGVYLLKYHAIRWSILFVFTVVACMCFIELERDENLRLLCAIPGTIIEVSLGADDDEDDDDDDSDSEEELELIDETKPEGNNC